MSLLIQAVEKMLNKQPVGLPGGFVRRQALEYICTGSEKLRAKLPLYGQTEGIVNGIYELPRMLPPPDECDEGARRAIEVAARFGHYHGLGEWLGPYMLAGGCAEDHHALLTEAFARAGRDAAALAGAVIERFPLERPDGQLTSSGRWLLRQPDEILGQGVRLAAIDARLAELLDLVLRRCPAKVEVVGAVLADHPQSSIHVAACLALLRATGGRFVEPLLCKWQALDDATNDRVTSSGTLPAAWSARLQDTYMAEKVAVGLKLAAVDSRFEEPVRQYFLAVLTDLKIRLGPMAMASIAGEAAVAGGPYLDALAIWLGDPQRAPFVLKGVVEKGGPETAPILRAVLDLPRPELRLVAAARLLDLNREEDAAQQVVQAELAGAAPLVGFVAIAAAWRPAVFADGLWKHLGNKSKPVRDAALRGLVKLGEAAVPRALQTLAARKAVERQGAVLILAPSSDPKVRRALEEHARKEKDDSVRDRIAQARDAGNGAFSMEALKTRIERSRDKLSSPPASWIVVKELPKLQWKDGSRVDESVVRYLLYRQSRNKEMSADIEAKAVYAEIDRASGGEFAVALLKWFLGVSQLADDRWVLALCALVGDDRLVPVLTRQIDDWAQHARGKMAEYAVRALALMGTDAALSAVNVMSIRYSTRFRNIGAAAEDAFPAAARALGISADELGDRVVPDLGLPRTEKVGERQLEFRVDLDGKLAIRDVEANKSVAALPKSAPKAVAEAVAAWKAALKEVWKGQVFRLEGLMVRQMRWPVARWSELYLAHPVLFPFAVRLVWGWYDGQGILRHTFRALEDRTLTTAADEPFPPAAAGSVGIVHPLELTAEMCGQWATHLADYGIAPPFPQLSRAVVRVEPEDAGAKEFTEVAEVQLNAMTFRGRAEKLGWTRGSVCDAGGIRFYHKGFPEAGAEALLELEDLYVTAGMEDSVTLGNALFVKAGSVQFGSYVYDEPESPQDPRVLACGDVPAIAYSETVSDLRRIAGGTRPAEED